MDCQQLEDGFPVQLILAARLSSDAPQLNPQCITLKMERLVLLSSWKRKLATPIVLSKDRKVMTTDSDFYASVLAERITTQTGRKAFRLQADVPTTQPVPLHWGRWQGPKLPQPLSHLQLSSNTLYKELPASVPGVHQALAFDFIPHTIDDVFDFIVWEEVGDFTYEKRVQFGLLAWILLLS